MGQKPYPSFKVYCCLLYLLLTSGSQRSSVPYLNFHTVLWHLTFLTHNNYLFIFLSSKTWHQKKHLIILTATLSTKLSSIWWLKWISLFIYLKQFFVIYFGQLRLLKASFLFPQLYCSTLCLSALETIFEPFPKHLHFISVTSNGALTSSCYNGSYTDWCILIHQ